MAAFLSDAWFDALRGAPISVSRPGADARFEVVVAGAPGGDVRTAWVIEGGVVRDAKVGAADEPEATITTTWADAVRMQQGELDPGAAFMQGRLKVAGDMGSVLRVLPVTVTPEFAAWRDAVTSNTDF